MGSLGREMVPQILLMVFPSEPVKVEWHVDCLPLISGRRTGTLEAMSEEFDIICSNHIKDLLNRRN